SLAELAALSHVAAGAVPGRAPGFGATLAFLARRGRPLVAFAARLLGRVALLLLPVAAAAAIAWFGWLGAHDINYYLAEKPDEWQRSLWLTGLAGAACGVAIALQLARWLYVLPILAVKPGATVRDAMMESTRLTHGRLWQVLAPLLAWWLLVATVAGVCIWIGSRLSASMIDWAGMDIRRLLPVVGLCVATTMLVEFASSGAGLAGQQFQLVRGVLDRQTDWNMPDAGPDSRDRGVVRAALRTVVVVGLAALVAATLSWLAVAEADLRPRVEVTAHRGASAVAPENTMAAFRAAIDAGTDWIELDVQRLADGDIVVLHDRDFLRVGGDARQVGAVTAADLAGIGFGARYGPAFAGEHPPLLDDVIRLARGRARLNVELKYNVPDPGLAPAVVAILQRERFLDHAVITSLDYEALRQVKRIEPRAVTGHIITAAVGNVVRSEADFLSLNAARATSRLVRSAHRAGKRVHVWTVNTREGMLELAARGVDNIITDDPALFARVRSEVGALDPHELLGLRLRALFGRPPPEVAEADRIAPL
ncbi:MAG TPA: glycerophosphodiester phosphodiesterase family protein, partial [Steroidobacteraceae bacterium]|nr:glycerophosphodiester phosphodiesterase family protein [Steroidobacteraceae bacterium]